MPFMKGRTDVLDQLATEQAKVEELEAKLKEIAIQSGHCNDHDGRHNSYECRLCEVKVWDRGPEHIVHKPECLLFDRTKEQAT